MTKNLTLLWFVAIIILIWCFLPRMISKKQAQEDGILLAEGAISPLRFPNLFGDVGAYNSV